MFITILFCLSNVAETKEVFKIIGTKIHVVPRYVEFRRWSKFFAEKIGEKFLELVFADHENRIK